MDDFITSKALSYANNKIATDTIPNEGMYSKPMNNIPMNTTPIDKINTKIMDNKAMDNKGMDNKSLDNKSLDNKSMDNKTMDNKLEPTKPTTNIQVIIDKIKNLPIPNDDKVILMKQFKKNIVNPSLNEDSNLNHIENKYLHTNPNQIIDTNYLIPQPQSQYIPQLSQHMQSQQPQQQAYMPLQHMASQQPHYMPQPQQNMYQGDVMTTAHFEILKNKIDSLQYELIDLLRHVKDYTQRYMNSIRQQDLDKIDEYINGLFEVDKALKETKEQVSEVAEVAAIPKEEPETQEGVISKATNGIKNAMGNLGASVSGITNLVSSTANIANSYLSKPIISISKDKEVTPELKKNDKKHEKSNSTNIVSIDEYINNNNKEKHDLEKQDLEKQDLENPARKTSENEEQDLENTNTEEDKEEDEDEDEPENTNTDEDKDEQENTNTEEEEEEPDTTNTEEDKEEPENTNTDKETDKEEEEPVTTNTEEEEPVSTNTDKEEEEPVLGTALEELNKKINKAEAKKIIKEKINTDKQSGGGSYKTLKNNIEILKLKLTKKKLQHQLFKNNKNKNKTKHKFKKNNVKKNTKHKLK